MITDMTPDLTMSWETWQLAQGLSHRTVFERLAIVRRIARETDTDPDGLTHSELITWLASHQSWSAGTRATYHASLRAWFRWLVEQDHRQDNPMVKTGNPRRPRGRPRPVTDAHLQVLLTTRMHARTRVMIQLAALAGLRVHEIAKLRGEEVDLIGGYITVLGKGSVLERIPLHADLRATAQRMPRRGWWFPSHTLPGPIRGSSVSQILTRVMRRADVPGTAHALRHWYGTTLVDDGADLRSTQQLLRHASLATTQIYTQISDRRIRAAIDRLDMHRGQLQSVAIVA